MFGCEHFHHRRAPPCHRWLVTDIKRIATFSKDCYKKVHQQNTNGPWPVETTHCESLAYWRSRSSPCESLRWSWSCWRWKAPFWGWTSSRLRLKAGVASPEFRGEPAEPSTWWPRRRARCGTAPHCPALPSSASSPLWLQASNDWLKWLRLGGNDPGSNPAGR